jgi:hypothetical protein
MNQITTTLPRISRNALGSLALLAAVSTAPCAHAAFTGITVTAVAGPASTPVGATTVYRVWANFDAGGGNCAGVHNFRFISATGFTGFVHNDNNTAGTYSITSGSWFTLNSNNAFGATDSWVSLTEPLSFPTTSAIPVYGSGAPAGVQTWYPGDFLNNPQIPGILGAGVSWSADPGGPFLPVNGQQLLGQFVIAADAQVCCAADIVTSATPFGQTSPTAVTFDFNGNCVPAPGVIALLGLACPLTRARRRAR